VYKYVGSTFNYGLDGSGNTLAPPSENLTAIIDSPSVLAPNTTYSFQNPLLGSSSFNNFSVSLGSETCAAISPCNVGGSITTNSSGAISAWGLFIESNGFTTGITINGSSTASIYQIASSNMNLGGPLSYNTVPLYDVQYASNGLAGPDFAYGSTVPGTWSVSAVPLPSSVWLLLSALGLMSLPRLARFESRSAA
jgi:hypothetical protein